MVLGWFNLCAASWHLRITELYIVMKGLTYINEATSNKVV